MDVVGLVILLVVLVAVGAILYWFADKVKIPEPLRIVLYAGVAIVAIILVARMAGLRAW